MNKRLLLLTAILLIVFGSSSLLFYNNSKIVERKEINMTLTVTNNPNEVMLGNSTELVDFGVVLSGSIPKAHLTFTNNHDKTVLITIKKSGKLSAFVSMSQNEFSLEPNQTKWVLLEASVPEQVDAGEYTGTLSITQSRA